MLYSKNLAERIRQIHRWIPPRQFPPGFLPGYVPFMEDQEIDEWVAQQWDGYTGPGWGLKPYEPGVVEVSDKFVAEVEECFAGALHIDLRSSTGFHAHLDHLRGSFWVTRFTHGSRDEDLSYGIRAALRNALEKGYRVGALELESVR